MPYRGAMSADANDAATDAPVPNDHDAVLDEYRASIDNIDAAIIHLLAERFKITRRVGEYKATHDLPPADTGREAQQIQRLRALAHDADLDPEFGEAFLRFIISEVIRHHEKARG
jgi:chorismate mutase